jgi:putative membrane protein
MGVAEVIPGISGSTAALLAGIYDELIRAIKSIDKEAGKLLLEKKFHAFWKHINGDFLATVFGGILTTFLLGARPILYALKHHPIPMGAFFFSLMVMATPLVMREEIKKWDIACIICLLLPC